MDDTIDMTRQHKRSFKMLREVKTVKDIVINWAIMLFVILPAITFTCIGGISVLYSIILVLTY